MAYNLDIQSIKTSSTCTNDLTFNMNRLTDQALWGSYNQFDLTYEDYVGIYHQIMAMELGYTK